MAFQTGTTATIDILMSTLSTFLQANGWTQDHFTSGDPGRCGFSKNGVFVAFQWTDATDGGTLAIYQNTSNDDTTSVWLSTGDSGVGEASTTASAFDGDRCVNQFAGPHTGYWFFEQNASPAYCHVVVEVDAGRYRHFGFGEIEKIGDWSGGEYAYGHFWSQAVASIDNPPGAAHSFHMDSAAGSAAAYSATLRVTGMPEQVADPLSEWARVNVPAAYPDGTDRAGNNRGRVLGGMRGGWSATHLARLRASVLTAFKPIIPLPLFWTQTAGAPDAYYFLGSVPDTREVNIGNIAPGETFSIGGETWYVFPWVRKQFLTNNTEESWNGGVAYRREDA